MRSEKKFVISVSVINITGCVNVRLEDNIKTDLKEIEWGGGVNWANLAGDRKEQIDLLKTVRILWAV